MSIAEYFDYLGSVVDQQEVLAAHLLEWNVEDDDGRPVPATLDGVRSREPDEVMAIKQAWTDAMTTIPENDPLALSSTGGLQAMLDLPAAELPAST
jgi:hypothetical protein